MLERKDSTGGWKDPGCNFVFPPPPEIRMALGSNFNRKTSHPWGETYPKRVSSSGSSLSQLSSLPRYQLCSRISIAGDDTAASLQSIMP